MNIKSEKAKIRKLLLGNRRIFPKAPEIESDLSTVFKKHIKFKPNQIIAGYYPTKNEIDITYLLRDFSLHHTIALPITESVDRNLIFRVWDPFKDPKSTNQFDIPEPADDAEEVLPTILIVPCIGLSPNGHRIGYGYGYYDRTINALRNQGHEFLTVGVGYEYQRICPLPFDGKDAQLDWIITNKYAFNCNASAIPIN